VGKTFRRLRRRWQDNIENGLLEVRCEDDMWMELTQGRFHGVSDVQRPGSIAR
jgi:hypothetical protein